MSGKNRLRRRKQMLVALRRYSTFFLLLSLLCTVIDAVRRWIMVERPVRRIVAGAEKIMQGDLSTRIQPFHSIDRLR